ncbi:hypothetical protein RHMOL_Rhmol02G0069100 [Rhododendron molle]|uniref:Uncharacterized protein n=1 Tax=Rhododendron molle TaxID=49168 RepID=A0ACC0PPY8_RHOML|nr:hypothetical protein RHMOL_Rhmol02G0069100 [Rhododendron molle]
MYQLFNLIVESMEGNVCKEQPEDCWESILNQLALDHGYNGLEAPSLVCKQFLSITNRLRRNFVSQYKVFYHNRCEALCRAFQRFRNLKELEICDPSFGVVVDKIMDIDYIISRIASSGFDLQSLVFTGLREPPSKESFLKLGSTMRNLMILRFCEFFSLRDPDIVAIADSFPWLEELDISGPGRPAYYYDDTVQYPQLSNLNVTDAGIEKLSVKLLALRKIDVSGNDGSSDRSLIALSSHCMLLEEIGCRLCPVTEDGVCFVLRHSPNLMSLTAGKFFPSPDFSSTFGNSLIYARALRVLDLYDHKDVDGLLSSVVKAGIPLEKLRIETKCNRYREEDYGFSLHGLSTFLRGCPSLKHLEVWSIYFLNDHAVRDLCQYFSIVVSIKLMRWEFRFCPVNMTMPGRCGPNGNLDCFEVFNSKYGASGMAMKCRCDPIAGVHRHLCSCLLIWVSPKSVWFGTSLVSPNLVWKRRWSNNPAPFEDHPKLGLFVVGELRCVRLLSSVKGSAPVIGSCRPDFICAPRV